MDDEDVGGTVKVETGSETAQEDLGRAAKRADRLEVDLAVAVTQAAALERSLSASQAAEVQLRREVAGLTAAQADLLAANAELAAGLAREHAHVEMLRSATALRAAAALGTVLQRLPSPARVALRRAARGAWWAATPHLTLRRLAIRRHRSSPGAVDEAGAAPQPEPSPPEVETAIAALPELPEAGRGVSIAFRPFPAAAQSCDRPVDRNGDYAFDGIPGRYTYVPPRRPDQGTEPVDAAGKPVTFSIVVPVYNTDPDLLDRMVASVLAQWHAGWELIIVDDASTDERTQAALARLAEPRIRVARLPQNGGISAATNAAIAMATGDFIVFLDHDDELTSDCLYELAGCIAREAPDFVYSDEDKIDPEGHYIHPFFKPDWSPDTMMSTMYTCHVMCVRRSMFDVVGDLRSAFDGSQDYDLVLRLAERTDRIAHIAKVLYHWRVIPASTAADLSAKPHAVDAARRVREAALERRGLVGTLEPVAQAPLYFRVNYALRGAPLISIIIPTRNNAAMLARCLRSIEERTRYANFEILVMDNGSTEADAVATLQALRRQARTRVAAHAKPFNYSEINNAGVRQARGDLLLFLNDDTEVISEDWLDRMGGYAQLAHVGAVGAKLLYPDTRRIQHSGVLNLDQGPSHAFHDAPADVPTHFLRNLMEWNWAAVTGACLMVERRKFDAVGGFDEAFPIAYNDVKLCFDLSDRGTFNVVCPSVELIHHESQSRGLDETSPAKTSRLRRERLRLYQRCPRHFMRDPFHNPNLSPTSVHFDLPTA